MSYDVLKLIPTDRDFLPGALSRFEVAVTNPRGAVTEKQRYTLEAVPACPATVLPARH